MHLLHLNDDVLLEIVHVLPRMDLYNFVLTCRRAYNFGIPMLLSSVSIFMSEYELVGSFCNFVLQKPAVRAHWIRELRLLVRRRPLDVHEKTSRWRRLADVLRHARNLKSLHIQAAHILLESPDFMNAMMSLPQLTRLSLGSPTQLLKDLLRGGNPRFTLKELVFMPELAGLEALRGLESSLEVLDFDCAYIFDPSHFSPSSIAFEKVHTLTIRQFQRNGKPALIRAFPKVRHLSLVVGSAGPPGRVPFPKGSTTASDANWSSVDALEAHLLDLWLFDLLQLRPRKLTLYTPLKVSSNPSVPAFQRNEVLLQYLAIASPVILSFDLNPTMTEGFFANIAKSLTRAKSLFLYLDEDHSDDDKARALEMIHQAWQVVPVQYLSITFRGPLRTHSKAGTIRWFMDPPKHALPPVEVWTGKVVALAKALLALRYIDFRWEAGCIDRSWWQITGDRRTEKMDTGVGRTLRNHWREAL